MFYVKYFRNNLIKVQIVGYIYINLTSYYRKKYVLFIYV